MSARLSDALVYYSLWTMWTSVFVSERCCFDPYLEQRQQRATLFFGACTACCHMFFSTLARTPPQ